MLHAFAMVNMKIGIITQPLGHNYGGVLQNYALQTVLKQMGHDVYTVNHGAKYSYFHWSILLAKNIVKRIIGRAYGPLPILPYKKNRQEKNLSHFIANNITTTSPTNKIKSSTQKKYEFEAYIVGSDQVWRPGYNRQLANMYLKFTQNYNVKRLAYAASFGVNDWEYTILQTQECSRLAKKFDLITVREDSAVKLCNKHLGVNAYHVLDPTMLLSKQDYIALLKAHTKSQTPQLTAYILDMNESKRSIIEETAQRLNLSVTYIGKTHNKVRHNTVLPSIEEWLAGFANADLILTDSFHGTVFSIIFNKPFYTFFNPDRGNARMQSLLSLTAIPNRLINCQKQAINAITIDPIDWETVNNNIDTYRQYSLQLLSSQLS